MAKPKFDYDSKAFYDELFTLAYNGLTDSEIADGLFDRFGDNLTPSVFSKMKNGKYEGWTKAQNKERSERISQVLSRARRKINALVRGAFLKTALGGSKIKNVVRVYAEQKCGCKGADMECELCHGTGRIVSKTKAIIQETEVETPKSLQGLSTWLRHHDEDWRSIERNEEKEDIPSDIDKGIDIDSWIREQVNGKKE